MVFQDRLVVVENCQGRAGLDVEVVRGSCVGVKRKRPLSHFRENARNFVFERKNPEFRFSQESASFSRIKNFSSKKVKPEATFYFFAKVIIVQNLR